MWPRTLWAWRGQAGVARGVVGGVLRLQEGVQRALGVDHEHAAARHAHVDVGPAAALLGVDRGLLVEVEAAGQARGLQHVAQGLLAPAALHAGAAAQRRRQLARLVLGGGRGLHQRGDLLLQPAGLLGAGLLDGGDLLLELGQGLGHRLQLRLQPGLGQLLAAPDRLLVALEDLLGDRLAARLRSAWAAAPARPARARSPARSSGRPAARSLSAQATAATRPTRAQDERRGRA